MSKRIAFFCASLQAGGAERVLSVLSKPLADYYDEVQYIMWYEKPVFYHMDDRVKLVSVEKESGDNKNLKKMSWLRQYVRVVKPDLLISFSAPFNMISLASLIFTNQKIVAAERVDPRSFRWGKHLEIARNLLYKRADGILAQTQYSKNYFSGDLYNKSDVIYNPVVMSADIVGSAIKTPKRNVIITAARLESQKRQDLLIEVFAEFKKNHPNYELHIYGDGTKLGELKALSSKLGIADFVKFPGVVNDLWKKMKSCRMFVMTSLFEGMSNSLIEAMCLGLPCISTKVSGAVDLIKSNENGVLIDIDDRAALLKGMNSIADDDAYAKNIGINASKLYDSLNVDSISRQWISYIDMMIKK